MVRLSEATTDYGDKVMGVIDLEKNTAAGIVPEPSFLDTVTVLKAKPFRKSRINAM